MKVQVYKDGRYDWTAWCPEHYERVWCDSWADAYEAAAGHVVMHHPTQR